jgi:Spy/CpxP family protein refolding chaperone
MGVIMNRGIKRIMVGIAAVVLLGGLSSVAWAEGGSGYWRSGAHGIGKAAYGHGYGFAQHGITGHGSAHRAAHWLLKHQQDLGLTDEQVAKIKALSLDQDRARIRATADVKVAERELRSLVSDEKTELTAIEAKVKERAMLDANLHMIGIKAKRELAAVLSPEQREKQKAILERMHRAHRGRQMKAEAQGEEWAAQAPTEQVRGTEAAEAPSENEQQESTADGQAG